jgi:hypothetical protein
MHRNTIPTITEAIISTTEALRDRLHGSTGCGVGTGEDPGFGGIADVLREVGDVGWVAHLDYGYYWGDVRCVLEGGKEGGKEEDELLFERAGLSGGVELKFASLVPHITSPMTWAPFFTLASPSNIVNFLKTYLRVPHQRHFTIRTSRRVVFNQLRHATNTQSFRRRVVS